MAWAFILGVLAVVAAWFLVPPGPRTPVLSGLVVAVLSCGAAVTPVGARRKLVTLGLGGAFGVGLVLAEFEPTAVVGVAVMALAVIATPPLRHWAAGAPPRWPALVVRVLAGVAVAAVPICTVSLIEVNTSSFAVRYGTPVSVVVASANCVSERLADPAGGRTVADTTCPGSTWSVSGAQVTGALHTSYRGYQPVASPIAAFAYGRDAYTADTLVVTDWFAALGFVPWWLIFLGPVMAVVFGMRRPALPFRTGFGANDNLPA
jgi:hypothetical protein